MGWSEWETLKRFDSSDTNVSKLVFENNKKNRAVAEAVLYKYPTFNERTVICCSTMSGCPVGCSFCGTGKFFIRNLTAYEIFDQVKACMDIAFYEGGALWTEIDKLQIMFMSMGEPMLNWGELKYAIRMINAAWPNAALLISTMGPSATEGVWEDLIALSCEIPKVGLQFSVHEAFEEERNTLIPMTHKKDLEQIAEYGERWFAQTGRKPFFNYCVHEGNNSEADIMALLGAFNPAVWECTLSVICESDDTLSNVTEEQLPIIQDFSEQLINVGYNVRVFNPSGQDDIGGGCGQLWYVQDWAKKNPSCIKKSHGTKEY